MEITQLLDLASNLFSRIDASTVHSYFTRNPSIRPTLSFLESKDKSIGFGPEKIMNLYPPSSDEESVEEIAFPSVRQVTERIMDSVHTSLTVFPHIGRAHTSSLQPSYIDNLWT